MPELVALEGPAGPAWVEELRRWWDGGHAVLPVDPRLPAPARDELLDALAPTVVVRPGRPPVRRPGRPAEAGDALVVATSGTTGAPKGVVLTRDAVAAAAIRTSAALDVDPAVDHWICCLPVAHAGGLGVVTRALITGTPLTILPVFDAGEVARAAKGPGRPLVSLVATALRRVEPERFRVILLGGDAPPAWGPPDWPAGRPASVVVTYGMTETGGGCVYDGVPLADVDVDIDGGEVRVRGPVLGRAYRDAGGDRLLTARDGWYRTGDGGRLDTDGRLVVDGRLTDVIITGGEKVWPARVESVLAGCPGVGAVAVVARPDPEWGQRVVAVVVPSDATTPPTLHDLRSRARELLPPWALPRDLELVDALPRTALGKVRRSAVLGPAPVRNA